MLNAAEVHSLRQSRQSDAGVPWNSMLDAAGVVVVLLRQCRFSVASVVKRCRMPVRSLSEDCSVIFKLMLCLDNCRCWGNFELMSDVEVKSEVDGGVNEDKVPSSIRIWRAERAKK